MSVYIDRKYLLLVSSKLRNFKDKGNDLYNFSCPFCGDSASNKTKARGYVFRKQDNYILMCHNCNISMGFSKFLKEIDYGQYKKYLLEKFGNHKNIEVSEKRKAAAEAKKDSLFGVKPTEKFAKKVKIDIPSIKSLDYNHPARQYISNRKIPDTFWSEIYWAEDFKNFMDKTFPDHGKEDLIENDPRVVLFFTNREGDITNVAGRVIEKDTPRLRYISIKVSEERKVFGINRTDLKSTLYVVER